MESRRMNRHAQDADRLVRRGSRPLSASTSDWDSLLATGELGTAHERRGRSGSNQVDKDALVDQLKQSFHLETQNFRSRILEATGEAMRARERMDDVHQEMLKLRKKCFKLQKMVQERDATIACMQEQQDLQLPMLMNETMRSLRHAMEDNQDDEQMVRSSVHRNRHQRSIMQEEHDNRVHEYEKQISRLYEELHQEKQKNEMLQECLKDQKHTKKKLMKACKFAKQEIEALRASDISHLLEDLEIKCKDLEQRNAALQDDLDFETTQVATARQERDDLEEELASRRQESSDWAARLEAKQREIERLRAQIHEQQCSLENFQQDYDLVAERTAPRAGDINTNAELQHECDLLIRALHREKTRVADLERQLEEASILGRSRVRDRSRSPESDEAAGLHSQIASVREKVSTLHRRLVEYTETQGLSSSSSGWRSRAISDVDSLTASEALSQCSSELKAMQRLMEEAFARALGNNCAMQ